MQGVVAAAGEELGRNLPHNAEAERSVLGSILLDNYSLAGVQSLLDHAEYFFFAQHRELYEAMLALDSRQQPIDLTLLNEELERRDAVEKAGGPEYLVRLVDECPVAVNAEYYAGIVRDHYIQRKLIDATREILEECYRPAANVHELIDIAEQRVFEINEKRAVSDVATMKEILKECFKSIEASLGAGSQITGLSTGFHDLDEMTCGLHPAELIILAARPSMGKTSLAMNVAEHVAIDQRKGVAIFSLEVSRNQLVQNLLCSRARVNAHKLRKGQLDKESFQKLSLIAQDLADAPLYIDDTPGMNLMKLRAGARRMKRRYDIQLIIIDYLQLLNGPPSSGRGAENRQQEISTISRGLKALARELSVPVITLSQLNRETDKREDHKPRLADLRESGALEQDADVVMLIYREEYYYPDREEVKGKAQVILAKQRHGPVGDVDLAFQRDLVRFSDLAHAWVGEP